VQRRDRLEEILVNDPLGRRAVSGPGDPPPERIDRVGDHVRTDPHLQQAPPRVVHIDLGRGPVNPVGQGPVRVILITGGTVSQKAVLGIVHGGDAVPVHDGIGAIAVGVVPIPRLQITFRGHVHEPSDRVIEVTIPVGHPFDNLHFSG